MTQMKKTTILSEEKDAEQLELSDIVVEIQNTLKHSVPVYKECTHSIHHSNPVKTGLYKDLYVEVYNSIIINAKPRNNPNALSLEKKIKPCHIYVMEYYSPRKRTND